MGDHVHTEAHGYDIYQDDIITYLVKGHVMLAAELEGSKR